MNKPIAILVEGESKLTTNFKRHVVAHGACQLANVFKL